MQKPFLTYEQFVAEKERLTGTAVDDALQREEDIAEIRKPDREDGISQTEMPDKVRILCGMQKENWKRQWRKLSQNRIIKR